MPVRGFGSQEQHGRSLFELFVLAPHLIEVCVDILSTPLLHFGAADLLRKTGDANDISRLYVLSEEIAACPGHVLHLIPCKKEIGNGSIIILRLFPNVF